MPASSPFALLLAHAAVTAAMFGVILVVQVVHYPLFGAVGGDAFGAYHAAHVRRITWVVGPLMLAELGAAVALAAWRPPGVPAWLPWTGLALLAAIWASTAFLQVPIHDALGGGFDGAAHRRLVATNLVRTLAWGLRTALAFAAVGLAVRAATIP